MSRSALGRRSPQGSLLRAGLDEMERQGLVVPEGARGVAAVVVDADGYEVGLAWRTPRGWTVEGSVTDAMRDGKSVRVGARVTW